MTHCLGSAKTFAMQEQVI